MDGSEAPPAEQPEAMPTRLKRRRHIQWWAEVRSIFWLLLIVLGFHSFVAKPFYIPSESMLPGLQVGDRLVVNKFAYGWSFVSPTIPNPIAIFDSLVLRRHEDSWAVRVPFIHGRLFGSLPERGDVVIVTPPGTNSDYIKRVIGLPGDRLEVRGGTVILNGAPVRHGPVHDVTIPSYGGTMMQDGRETCDPDPFGNGYGPEARTTGNNGHVACRLPIVTETLPNGRRYDTVELGESSGDNYPAGREGSDVTPYLTADRQAITIPAGHVFLMGDNRDRSADSRFPLSGLGLGGPVPYENIGGRAEFVTFSFDGSASWLNPLSWWRSLRSGRTGVSLHPVETR